MLPLLRCLAPMLAARETEMTRRHLLELELAHAHRHLPELVLARPGRHLPEVVLACKENGSLAHLLWILVFDDQHNQVGLINLQVIIL